MQSLLKGNHEYGDGSPFAVIADEHLSVQPKLHSMNTQLPICGELTYPADGMVNLSF